MLFSQNKSLLILSASLAAAIIFSGCKKMLKIDPPTNSVSAENVYTTNAAAISVLSGIYITMSNDWSRDLALYPGMSADEVELFDIANTQYQHFYRNNLTAFEFNGGSNDFWDKFYQTIYVTNAAIEGLEASTKLTPEVKQQLLGEAHFIRAFCYFYLVNLFGEVPLAISTDYKVNTALERQPIAKVYEQIIADLHQAQSLLNDQYVDGSAIITTPERLRPNKTVATALLARILLYTGDYDNAIVESSKIIDMQDVYNLTTPDQTFLKHNTEAIWQLQSQFTTFGANTSDGSLFVLPESGPEALYYPVYLSKRIAYGFEPNDMRRENWVDSTVVGLPGAETVYYFPFKYKTGNDNTEDKEYSVVFRLAEQFLIRAEARARTNDLDGAREDIDMIRTRAGLLSTIATTQQEILDAIEQEFKVEYFTEWGHRWFNLKRTGRVDAVMSVVTPLKGGSWNTNWQWYPVPLDELKKSPFLHQNAGY